MEEYHRKVNTLDKRFINDKITKWKNIIKQGDFCEKCGIDFRILKVNGKPRYKHPHHIISEEAVRNKYKELIEDLNNGILLCATCHKMADDSAHEGGLNLLYF